jgi:hypothetical protein
MLSRIIFRQLDMIEILLMAMFSIRDFRCSILSILKYIE